MFLAAATAQAQIKIGGNVYGGGNAGDMTGNTSVTVRAGDLQDVYGGARIADVGGRTFVNIDGEHASDDILITNVYGGNDIAGNIGKDEAGTKALPEGLAHSTENSINDSWDAIVRTTACKTEATATIGGEVKTADKYLIVIGSLFGGGNGDYTYGSRTTGTGTEYYAKKKADDDDDVATSTTVALRAPVLPKAYLEVMGGNIAHVYGGGNNATVTEATTICIDNRSDDLEKVATVKAANEGKTVTALVSSLQSKVDLRGLQRYLTSYAFNHARVFGGNNKAEMAIMPKWDLRKGIIRDLYGGGNAGPMTSEHGILLEIGTNSEIVVNNVFGGCRKADVNPKRDGVEVEKVYNIEGYHFPEDFASRVIVRGGDVNNIYGGNDISGKVHFGSAVGVYADIRGNVYGGGNGNYAYTDNPDLKDDPVWGDYYYDVKNLLGTEANGWTFQTEPSKANMLLSVKALNLFRPNAEQVSIRVAGLITDDTDPENPVYRQTIIGGSVFVGGNCATLKPVKKEERTKQYQKEPSYPMAELKIGSHIIVDKMFLGNNGEYMIDTSPNGILETYAGEVTKTGTNVTVPFSKLGLADADQFKEYMEAVVMESEPNVAFDHESSDGYPDYIPYSASIGSFYCGGNVGSMRNEKNLTEINFDHQVIIYDKLVGGCNKANVEAHTNLNAAYLGGLIGPADDNGNKLILNLSGLKIQPKRWKEKRVTDKSSENYYKKIDDDGNLVSENDHTVYYDLDDNGRRQLEWNTVDSRRYHTDTKTYDEVEPVTSGSASESNGDDLSRRLYGGNIYGGCYTSGYVNGNVVINLNASIEDRDILFDKVESNELGEEESLYGTSQTGETNYKITERRTGVILGQQGMDVFGSAMNVFGGGKGKDTEIWGSTTINVNKGYTFQVFGGSEDGVIGKPETTTVAGKETIVTTTDNDYVYNSETGVYAFNGKKYKYNSDYSCYVNLCGTVPGVSKAQSKIDNNDDIMAECEFLYGGGFFGPICGNTIINMGDGRVFNSFAGSCNADILGHTESYIGRQVKDGPESNKYQYKNVFATHVDAASYYRSGFPWIRDITYGGNDLGGRIFSEKDFTSHVRTTATPSEEYPFDVIGKVHKDADGNRDVLTASAYTEYLQGRADAIFGGCYGTYNYSDPKFERYTDTNGDPLKNGDDPLFYKPRLDNAFVNFRPTYYSDNNVVKRVFGAGQGESGEKERDLLQNRSYVLIDIPEVGDESDKNFSKYSTMEVFGAGAWGGVGMNGSILPQEKPADTATDAEKATYKQYLKDLDKHSAIIDLVRGDIGAAYGASYEEGVTRRTLVNVPTGSTIKIGSIFGGGYGNDIYLPCDAYEANVEYHSADAWLKYNPERKEGDITVGNKLYKGAIYGGNNSARRTLYATINIDVKVNQDSYKYGSTTGYVYGAGYGGNTWAEYTLVNLKRGAEVFEAYGGGEAGKVFNTESVHNYLTKTSLYKPATWPAGSARAGQEFTDADWAAAWKIGGGLDPATDDPATENVNEGKAYWESEWTNLANPLVRVGEMDDREYPDDIPADELALVKNRYTANVIINEGAYVNNYVYGGGYGHDAVVSGTTYVALLGGEVNKDIYAAGTSGDVEDMYGVGPYSTSTPYGFVASTNVYVKGGTVRNVYGGGWRGDVGHHAGSISNIANMASDVDAEAHIVIGDKDGTSHVNGIPSITRNLYGGGEGGAIFGDAYVTLNKGYIGYRYNSELTDDASTELDDRYVPELDDKVAGDNELEKGGNIFGGGYVANSYVDRTHVAMWDGIVRGSLYGGGEIGPVGRGTVHPDTIADLRSNTEFDYTPYIRHNYGFEGCQPAAIYKENCNTNVYLWGGHVMRDVFGGGRGYDNWNGEGYFQSEEEKQNMDRSSKGYVFGQTNVHIRGGEIGTEAGVLLGYGNVFGGGNEGYVYSTTGKKVGSDRSDEHLTNGKPTDGGGFYYVGGSTSNALSHDCYIAIEPYCKVIAEDGISGFTANETTGVKASYAKGEYVPVEALNQLQNRNKDKGTEETAGPKKWDKLDTSGITIHNALFAGGNITEGSDNLYANTVTVYGNAAASLRDVYNYDLISLGTEEMGGLYGDGNLTMVDGFRELHIDNYGTDFYSLKDALELSEYNELSKRQKAYYKLKYVTATDHTFEYWECQELHTFTYTIGGDEHNETYKRGQKISQTDYDRLIQYITAAEKDLWQKGHKTFQKDDQIEEGEYILMYGDEDSGEKSLWKLFGVTNIYDGRPLNTIQRADMCGVFGSRMVLKGAEDRVVDAVDYHLYTINRVDEVSLNKRESQAGDTDEKDKVHGNYFGIFNEVNYLGNLTSDVFFTQADLTSDHSAIRQTDSSVEANKGNTKQSNTPYGTATYYQWKAEAPQARNRNNGISHNKVALASGVFLEIKREEGELTGVDDWGYITGVVELDLINVMQGMGGGYVYARNEHGAKTWHGEGTTTPYGKVTVLAENEPARTYRLFTYETPDETGSNLQQIETSGNFVHNTKQIVDDCYPHGGIYKDGYAKSPAHYWFIRGSIYVYDQYISAFTGAANAYAEKVEMPLTISAASNGRMTLREVQPNYYAYYDKNGNKLGDKSANADETIIINNNTYRLNDPVSYWEYRLMSDAEKARFVQETYVVTDSCKVDGTIYPKGEVLLPSEYRVLKYGSGSEPIAHTVEYKEDDEWFVNAEYDFDYFFHPSNNLGHNTGYVLTYDVNNPEVWSNYYTQIADHTQKSNTKLSGYIEGPTFTPKAGMTSVYGQETKKVGDIIPAYVKTEYEKSGGVQQMVAYPAVPDGTMLTEGKRYYNSPTDRTGFVALGTEEANGTNYYENNQATVTQQAYIVTTEYSVKDTDGKEVQHLNPGTPIYESNYTTTQWTALTSGGSSAIAVPAKVCTTLLEFSTTDFIYAGQLMTASEVAALKSKVIAKNKYVSDDSGTADEKAAAFLATCFDDAYYCTEEGLYGGNYFETGHAYSALESWCSMTAAERENFIFNYDAFDVLVDPTFDGRNEANYGYKPQYDGYAPGSSPAAVEAGTASAQHAGSTPLHPALYSAQQPIDYTAEYTGSDPLTYYKPDGTNTETITASASESDWLTRTRYEAIPNEKHYYSPITVTAPGNYYVVNTVCMEGDVPYTVGQVIDEATYTSMAKKENVTVYNFTEEQTAGKKLDDNSQPVKDEKGNYVYNPKTYFYCREGFEIGEKGGYASGAYPTIVTTAITKDNSGVSSTTHTKGTGDNTEKGEIISQTEYDKLCNFQQGFIIHGVSPTETSTLYVSNESDIHNLSTEKIITVIYLYEYEESDESGNNVVPVSERHIVNIHIDFKSGVPEIGKITKPNIVLPGTTIGMNVPSVTQGAYRVTESGWELFENESDARTHINGTPYTNNETPVYWYQNNYMIAYYAKTHLGKTYSNSVPISVANYHDLKKVMDAKDHHYYIDHKDVGYEPKIYINDYKTDDPATTQNGLDLFRDLINLTFGTVVTGHTPLDLTNTSKPLRGGEYLEFFLRADQDYTGSEWTPIANNSGECFSGILHGDGHTIKGLDHSLFQHLCGEVYNLGVTGSFTGAGIAEDGSGYVENTWISTSTTNAKTTKPVFGAPSRTDAQKAKDGEIQIVNSYYQEEDNAATVKASDDETKTIAYTNHSGDYGIPTRKPMLSFYNGEVTYNLNGFYLYKRYNDKQVTSEDESQKYQYYTVDGDNVLTLQPAKYYDSHPEYCSSGYKPTGAGTDYIAPKYVEDRFADGDFIYADGTIPGTPNKRLYVNPDTREEVGYFPIWPDDYLFFGQALNYSHMDGLNGRDSRTHQPFPSTINKINDQLVTTKEGYNRVYRAPAYFRSKEMGMAYFNPYAVFVDKEKLTDEQIAANVVPRLAYKDMTAIDFTGHNDAGYNLGWDSSNKYFYQPLLDDGGLEGIYISGITSNVLAYTMTSTTAAAKTNKTVSGYMTDQACTETDENYRTVASFDNQTYAPGHWVQLTDAGYRASRDHLLHDKQDFNAPISYTFSSSNRMWYQRKPNNYVDRTMGWEAVSLPFSAELVTTHQKGEITHFYSGSAESKNGTGTKIGHEYWLREFTGGLQQKTGVTDATTGETINGILEGNFNYPSGTASGSEAEVLDEKDYMNTFLWDYYYENVARHNQKDWNKDNYQEYYSSAHRYKSYPMLTKAIPYIIGFPGPTYYEFDLSGAFDPSTTAKTLPSLKLDKQTITFASQKGATIGVSDDEMAGVSNTITISSPTTTTTKYTFKPSYMNESFAAGSAIYTMKSEYDSDSDTKADCSSFVKVPNAPGVGDDPVPDIEVAAFRPYFMSEVVSGARPVTRAIVFNNDDSQLQGVEEKGNPNGDDPGNIKIYAKKHKIIVESALTRDIEIRIVNTAGITMSTFTLEPGETVETRIINAGVYIVQSTDGRYLKKLAVK